MVISSISFLFYLLYFFCCTSQNLLLKIKLRFCFWWSVPLFLLFMFLLYHTILNCQYIFSFSFFFFSLFLFLIYFKFFSIFLLICLSFYISDVSCSQKNTVPRACLKNKYCTKIGFTRV